MTPAQFQEAHGPWLKSILSDPKGQALINTLVAFQPLYPKNELPHLFAQAIGQREGFEICLKAFVSLSNAPKIQTEVEANYGVPEVKK